MPELKRILVVKLSSLGDIMHALPTVEALRVGTGATVDWLTQMEYVDLLGAYPELGRVIGIDRKRLLRDLPRVRRELRAERYDMVIDLHGLLKSAVPGFLSGCKRRIGPSFHGEGARLFYTELAGPADRDRHRVEQKADVLQHLGLPSLNGACPLRFPPWETALPRPILALLPCSRHAEKDWPAEHFASLASTLAHEHGTSIVTLGSAKNRNVGDSILAKVPQGQALNLAGETNLRGLGSVLQDVELVVGNDTGPLHVAAALGTPVLGLYLATNPRIFGPYGDVHRTLKSDAKTPLDVESVLQAALSLLGDTTRA